MKIDNGKSPQVTEKTISYLHEIWLRKEAGRPIQPNPFYHRNDLLTPEIVEKCIETLEGIFTYELEKYPGYHRNAQGISESEYLAPPGFDKMTYNEKFAIVQGMDEIFQEFKANPNPPASVVIDESQPPYIDDYWL